MPRNNILTNHIRQRANFYSKKAKSFTKNLQLCNFLLSDEHNNLITCQNCHNNFISHQNVQINFISLFFNKKVTIKDIETIEDFFDIPTELTDNIPLNILNQRKIQALINAVFELAMDELKGLTLESRITTFEKLITILESNNEQ